MQKRIYISEYQNVLDCNGKIYNIKILLTYYFLNQTGKKEGVTLFQNGNF